MFLMRWSQNTFRIYINKTKITLHFQLQKIISLFPNLKICFLSKEDTLAKNQINLLRQVDFKHVLIYIYIYIFLEYDTCEECRKSKMKPENGSSKEGAIANLWQESSLW